MSEYSLNIPVDQLTLLKQWNKDDPVSCHEMRRNNRIEELQGIRNKYIDHSSYAEHL